MALATRPGAGASLAWMTSIAVLQEIFALTQHIALKVPRPIADSMNWI